MVGAAVVFAEVVTVGRYALTGTIARAVAARHRINAADAEPDPSSSSPPPSRCSETSASGSDETAPGRFALRAPGRRGRRRLIGAPVSGARGEASPRERHARRVGLRGRRGDVCARAASTSRRRRKTRRRRERRVIGAGRDAARGLFFLSARRDVLRLSRPFLRRRVRAGRSARETNNGWTAMFASDARAFTDASAEADDSSCRAEAPSAKKTDLGLKRGRRRVAGGRRAQRHVRGGAGRVGVEPGDARGSGRRDDEPGR